MYQGNDCMSQISGLLDCYGQVQAATAFIKQVLASTPMAMKGVTDGSAAQPGQVGEYLFMQASTSVPTAAQNTVISLGSLPPGDWDCWVDTFIVSAISDIYFLLNPQPAGFGNNMATLADWPGAYVGELTYFGTIVRALTSVTSLIAFQVLTNQRQAGPAASTAWINFYARRRR